MAMTMTGEATLPAARPKVWALLNDPVVLKACIPGCESLEKTGDNGFAAVAKVKIGPMAATFKGKVELSDIVPDVGYTITGEGEGGIAGFAKGNAKVALADAGQRHAAPLRRRGPCRRQDGPARLAPDRRRGQEHGRQVLRQFRRSRRGRRRARRRGRRAGSGAKVIPTKKSWFRRIWEWFMSR